jgi:hypothetical protein
MLRECRLDEMFGTMKMLVLQASRDGGEMDLAKVFSKSYLVKDDINCWYYCVSGIPGCIPQNNSHERSNLDIKAEGRGVPGSNKELSNKDEA